MGAIFGILGEGNLAELELMGKCLKHRGKKINTWSVSRQLHFGRIYEDTEGDDISSRSDLILFDGFIDNRDDLNKLLKSKGQEYKDDSDLIFDLYMMYGAKGLRYVSGQFSLVLWDERIRKLILACDYATTRPLYFIKSHGRFIFASECKALLAIDSVPAKPNREAIQYLQYTKSIMPGMCCLADVEVLKSGKWVELDNQEKSEFRYEDLKINVQHRTEAWHAQALKNNFINTVRKQINKYSTIGVSLSSGLDSAVIVAAVREAAPEKILHTFTAGSALNDKVIDEAAEVAGYFKAEHHKIVMNVKDLPEIIPQTVWSMEDPIGREENMFYFITAQEAKKYVPLLLAGHNSDCLFGGMPRHILIKLNAKLPFLWTPLEEFYNYTQLGTLPKSILGKAMVTAYFRGTQSAPPTVTGVSYPPKATISIERKSSQPMSEFFREDQLNGPMPWSAIEKIHASNQILYNSPFLDIDLVRSTFEIPDRLKIHWLTQKYILRKAFSGIMPEEMLKRKKTMQRLKHDKLFCDVLEDMAHRFLSFTAVKDRGFFNNSYVSKIIKRPKNGIYPDEQIYRLWSILLVEIWARLFLDARGNYVKIF